MRKPSSDRLLIERLTAEDLAVVAEIEEQEQSPWNMGMLRSELLAENGIQLVAKVSGTIIGWVCGRRVAEEAELLKIVVNDSYRRRGVGTMLLDRLVQSFTDGPVVKLFLEVRSMNRAAVEFYRGYGFAEIGRRRGYYKRPSDDAVIMEINLLERDMGKISDEKCS